MAAPNGTTTTLTGAVEAVNERSIKLQGAWLNLSKWKPLPLPTRGALVSVDVKDGRFLARIDVLDGQDAHSAEHRPRTLNRAPVRAQGRGSARGRPPRRAP
jgi:hypothetical protein